MDYKRGDLPPKEKTLIAPEGGWKERTCYVVDVACNKQNPIHRAILYVGFLNGKSHPLAGGYTTLWGMGSGSYDYPPHMQHYLKPLSVIEGLGDLEFKLPRPEEDRYDALADIVSQGLTRELAAERRHLWTQAVLAVADSPNPWQAADNVVREFDVRFRGKKP